jgi:hypothetical protein
MATSERKPRVADAVHYVNDDECVAGLVTVVFREEDGSPTKLRKVMLHIFFPGDSIESEMSEHSTEGHRFSYHYPDECPEQR